MSYTVYYVGGPLDGSKWIKSGVNPPAVLEYIKLAPTVIGPPKERDTPFPQHHVKYSLRHLASDIFIAQYKGEETF